MYWINYCGLVRCSNIIWHHFIITYEFKPCLKGRPKVHTLPLNLTPSHCSVKENRTPETTSHDRRVLAGSVKVFWFQQWKPWLFLCLFYRRWLATRLCFLTQRNVRRFSRSLPCRLCDGSFIQDVRLTSGCLKSSNTSFFLNCLIFFPLPPFSFKPAVCYCLHSLD